MYDLPTEFQGGNPIAKWNDIPTSHDQFLAFHKANLFHLEISQVLSLHSFAELKWVTW